MQRSWQPSASLAHLKIRAHILRQIREFFFARGVMEVETPVLCHTSVTDPHIESIPALFRSHPQTPEQRYYLQTSPEYAMKRLLAADIGPIYQISKSFRQGEIGRLHNPEFTMLEWYRPDFDHHALMQEMDDLLQLILPMPSAKKMTYAALMQHYLQIDAHQASLAELKNCAAQHNLHVAEEINDKDTWLTLLMSHCIEPQLGQTQPCFVYDFPASQAALARIQTGTTPVASRFEVYMHGIELANGFHELQDATEQRRRFEENLRARALQNLTALPIDELFLQALTHGLPDCAGVALGIDRLVMIAAKCNRIADIISFDFSLV